MDSKRDEMLRQVTAVVFYQTPARSVQWQSLGSHGSGSGERRVMLEARARDNYGDVGVTIEDWTAPSDNNPKMTSKEFNQDAEHPNALAEAVDYFVAAINGTES